MSLIDVGGLPKGEARGKTAERILFAEMLSRLETMQASMTGFMERYQGRLLNGVLAVETAIFDASGMISRNYHAPAGCIQVRNPGTHTVTVSSAGPTGSAPPVGPGVWIMPAASRDVVSLGSTTFTLYGTVGDTVSFQVFSIGPQPGVV